MMNALTWEESFKDTNLARNRVLPLGQQAVVVSGVLADPPHSASSQRFTPPVTLTAIVTLRLPQSREGTRCRSLLSQGWIRSSTFILTKQL